MQKEEMIQVWVTQRENSLLDIIRKVLFGSVEVVMREGEIRVVKKIIETYNLDKE